MSLLPSKLPIPPLYGAVIVLAFPASTEVAFLKLATDGASEFVFRIRQAPRVRHEFGEMVVTAEACHGPCRILQYEYGTTMMERDGEAQPQAKPLLRGIATSLGISLLNANGNACNTRQLGVEILRALLGDTVPLA